MHRSFYTPPFFFRGEGCVYINRIIYIYKLSIKSIIKSGCPKFKTNKTACTDQQFHFLVNTCCDRLFNYFKQTSFHQDSNLTHFAQQNCSEFESLLSIQKAILQKIGSELQNKNKRIGHAYGSCLKKVNCIPRSQNFCGILGKSY